MEAGLHGQGPVDKSGGWGGAGRLGHGQLDLHAWATYHLGQVKGPLTKGAAPSLYFASVLFQQKTSVLSQQQTSDFPSHKKLVVLQKTCHESQLSQCLWSLGGMLPHANAGAWSFGRCTLVPCPKTGTPCVHWSCGASGALRTRHSHRNQDPYL